MCAAVFPILFPLLIPRVSLGQGQLRIPCSLLRRAIFLHLRIFTIAMATGMRGARFSNLNPARRIKSLASCMPDAATFTPPQVMAPVIAASSLPGTTDRMNHSLRTRATSSAPLARSGTTTPVVPPLRPNTSYTTSAETSPLQGSAATFAYDTALSATSIRSLLISRPPGPHVLGRPSVLRHSFSCHFSVLFLSVCVLPLLYCNPTFSQPWCKYSWSLTPEETTRRNCGFVCPDPWGKDDPHDCGPPDSCCCAPVCDVKEAEKHAFVGVNWSDKYSRMRQSREKQLSILKDNGFYHIKTFSPDSLSSIWKVYGSEGNVHVGLPNLMLTRLATDENFAVRLVERQLKPYSSIIRTIVVGNEPLLCIRTAQWASKQECGSLNVPAKLLPAMRALKKALESRNLSRIPVTTALNGGVLEMSRNPWTPCVADYRDAVKPILRQLWSFLSNQTPPAPFVVNIYSWFAALNGHIKPDIAVGHPSEQLPADGKYKYYFNFDMQVEMQRVAMCKNNITHLDLWIGETGWPTANSPRATLTNAHLYNKHAVMRARGMTLHNATLDNIRTIGMPYPVFLFEAFDEAAKFEIEHGNMFENTFGIFYENGQPKWSDPDGYIDLPLDRQRPKTKERTTK